MRSGPDVSGSCAKCWKPVFKTKEAVIWKYGLVGYRERKEDEETSSSSCEHKILKVYRSDRYVAARCMHCEELLTSLSELRLVRNAIVKPRINLGASPVSRGRQRTTTTEPVAESPEIATS